MSFCLDRKKKRTKEDSGKLSIKLLRKLYKIIYSHLQTSVFSEIININKNQFPVLVFCVIPV